METIKKISEFEISITPEVVVQDEVVKNLDELQADLQQAVDSVAKQRADFEAMIAPQEATVDLFQARLDSAIAKGVVAKPVEVVEEVLPVEDIKPLDILAEEIIL